MEQKVQNALEQVVGTNNVLTGADDLKVYGQDWCKDFPAKPSIVVRPGSTREVAEVLRLCSDNSIAVVPSGGRTGVAGGAAATNGEVVVTLERMNKILAIDSVGMTITTEAGVTTQALQEAAAEVGLFFPIDLAAKGSCQIGGNIATNAGGVKLIRYGGTRDQVLGLEVVLANGEVLDLNTRLRKNNTGYDLKQFFVGSEGTLGIITSATLKLMAPTQNLQLTMMGVDDFPAILKILEVAQKRAVSITAFEFLTQNAHDLVLSSHTQLKTPFSEPHPYYVLLEVEQADNSAPALEPLLEGLFHSGHVSDAVIAQNSQQFSELWALRENIAESVSMHGHVRKNDVAVAVADLADFLDELDRATKPHKDIEILVFGHIGDGNLHINYIAPPELDKSIFVQHAAAAEKDVFAVLAKFRGSVSAEHGIGLAKKASLGLSRTNAEISWMRQIKKTFDPSGILNPGKIFDLNP